MSKGANRAWRTVHAFEDGVLASILIVMIFLAVTQIVLRNVFDTGLSWADPLLRNLVLWVGLIGAMVASREDRHITVDVVSKFAPSRARAAIRVFTDGFTACVAGMLAWSGATFVRNEIEFDSRSFLDLPTWVLELVIPVAFGVIALRYARFFVVHLIEAVKNAPASAPKGEGA